jgi:phage tail-like protein
MTKKTENDIYPLHVFRFKVEFWELMLSGDPAGSHIPLCSGAFSECSGLEATMEPKVIKEGGRNWGANQRAGQVTFSTIILKRGMTYTRDLWLWFDLVGRGAYAHRLNASIKMYDTSGNGVLSWELKHAMPIKFKAADLNAKGTSDVAIEELHLAHEGFTQESRVFESLFADY